MGSRTSTENLELIHRLIDPSLQHQLYRRSLPRLDARIAAEIGTILSTSSSTLNIPPSLLDRTGQAAWAALQRNEGSATEAANLSGQADAVRC